MPLASQRHLNLYQQHYAMRLPEPRKRSPWLPQIEKIAKSLDTTSVLDYGCGVTRGLSVSTELMVDDYDPGVLGLDAEPQRQYGLVCCIHVLEHVEPETLDDTIRHLESFATKAVFIAVSTEKSTKKLPDGSPWHSLVQTKAWWKTYLGRYAPRKGRTEKEFVGLFTKPAVSPIGDFMRRLSDATEAFKGMQLEEGKD